MLRTLTARQLIERTGCKFLSIRCVHAQAETPAPKPLPSALQTLVESAKRDAALHLPVPNVWVAMTS